jgi:hypothetical protein
VARPRRGPPTPRDRQGVLAPQGDDESPKRPARPNERSSGCQRFSLGLTGATQLYVAGGVRGGEGDVVAIEGVGYVEDMTIARRDRVLHVSGIEIRLLNGSSTARLVAHKLDDEHDGPDSGPNHTEDEQRDEHEGDEVPIPASGDQSSATADPLRPADDRVRVHAPPRVLVELRDEVGFRSATPSGHALNHGTDPHRRRLQTLSARITRVISLGRGAAHPWSQSISVATGTSTQRRAAS